MRRPVSVALIALGAIVALYGAVVIAAWALQGRLIYPVPPPDPDLPAGFDRIAHTTSDGLDLSAGYCPARAGMPTLLFFHGNGTSWHTTPLLTDRLWQAGYGVLAAEYRGYAGNPGAPSEAGFYRDAAAAWERLREEGVAAHDIVLVGNSIGSGAATWLASEKRPRALVLVSPFDSLEATATRQMRWLPVRLLLRDRYDNVGRFPVITAPILILHGEEDTLITPGQAGRLAAAHPDSELVTYPGWGHDLIANAEVQDRIARFLDGEPKD